MLKVGVIGSDFLINKNREILQEKNCQVIALQEEKQLHQVDAVIITGWQEKDYGAKINSWAEELRKMEKENMVMLAIAHGSIAMGQKGRLKLMDYWSTTLSTAPVYLPLEISSLDHVRFTACFLPDIRFTHVAPNLGILCCDKQRGPIILRQGNYLACNYVAELTKKTYLYDYWLEMVLSAKMT